MARTVTLSTLRTRVRERADMENSTFISDAECNRYISASYAELYDLLVKSDPERYQKYQTLTPDSSTTDFSAASDYYGTVRIDYRQSSNDYWTPVQRVVGREAAYIEDTAAGDPVGWHPILNTSASLENTTPMLRILPPCSSGYSLRHVYTKAPTDLSADTDTIDGVSGWEEYIVIDAAIKCLQKEESSTSHLERAKAAMLERIEDMAENRSLEQAGHVVNIRGDDRRDFDWTEYLDSSAWRNRP